MHTINIYWEGPFTRTEIERRTAPSDKGLYQIYGAHCVTGRPELLYIGLTTTTFAGRVPCHFEDFLKWTRDPAVTAVYIGRLCGAATPDDATWNKEIGIAEALLLYAHYPPYNTQKKAAERMPDFATYRVVNRGSMRELLPEVSGEQMGKAPNIQPYGTHGRISTLVTPSIGSGSPSLPSSQSGI